jgi:GNAT superfamily N-acetyltransferase
MATEKNGIVSIWVGTSPANFPLGTDALRDLCGVDYCRLDDQELNASKDLPFAIDQLLGPISYSESFLKKAIASAERLGIQQGYWAVVQFDFDYQKEKIKNSISSQPIFLGAFAYNVEVKKIIAAQTYPLRQQILVPNGELSQAKFGNDDDEKIAFHLGAFSNNELLSIASFFQSDNHLFQNENQYQLRGMATIPTHQGKGISSEILSFSIPLLRQKFCTLLWCNARTSAIGFYEKAGFRKINNEVFEIEGIGPHIVMYKNI